MNSNEPVHVKAYVRDDGTVVKEHWRSRDVAETDKQMLDIGASFTNKTNIFNLRDSAQLWRASSTHFKNIGEIKNSEMIDSVNKIGNKELRNIVADKVRKQIGLGDVHGIIFHPNSSLAQNIAKSPEVEDFIIKNKTKLQNGSEIKRSTLRLHSSWNLYSGLNYVDVLNAKINSNGDFEAIVLDTYDFNPNENNPLVQMGRKAQEAKLIRNYFTLNFLYIEKNEIRKMYKK